MWRSPSVRLAPAGTEVDRSARILVTGASGMVGGALARRLQADGYSNVLAPTRRELPLDDLAAVISYFERHRPDHVFMVAAKVGGIAANMADPAGFLADNLRLTLNLFEAARRFPTKKNLFLGSSCIYPRQSPQPMKEEYLLEGPLEPTNEGYALAKIAGLRLAQGYWHQEGLVTICPMPCNMYGTGDHFSFERAHVLSSLVRRFVDAQASGAEEVVVWGTGAARREFMHVDDLVDCMLFLMEHYESPDIINVGPGVDVSIRELAESIAAAVGYTGRLAWDASKPDGMPRKCVDASKLAALGFRPRVTLREGIHRTIAEYRATRSGHETGSSS